jgi:hypothetical protein
MAENGARGHGLSALRIISSENRFTFRATAPIDSGSARAQKNAASRTEAASFVSSCVKRNFHVLGRPGSDLLSQGLSHSTIGAEEFNGRVRDGIGLRLFARTTRPAKDKEIRSKVECVSVRAQSSGLTRGPTLKLSKGLHRLTRWTLKMRAIKPIERLVPVSYMHYCTSTPGLSTWSSSTVLKGMLVLRWVSRLDAFSGYPVRT